MKSFAVSSAVFLILILLVAVNACYVYRVSEELLLDLDSFCADSPEEELAALERYWEQNRGPLSLSVSTRDTDRMSEALVSLRAAYDTKSVVAVEQYRQIARNIAKDLCRLERFSLENLL